MSGKPLDTAFRALTAGIALTLILWISQLPTDPSVKPSTIPLEVNARRPAKSPRARITGIKPLEQRRSEGPPDAPAETVRNEIPPIRVTYGSRTAPVQIVSDRIETEEPDAPTLPEISIPAPDAQPAAPVLKLEAPQLEAPLPVDGDAKAAEPEAPRIPHELQRELDQLKDLRAQFKAVLDAKDADLDRLRRQNAELLGQLEKTQRPIEAPVPETPAAAPVLRRPEPVKPLAPPEPQLPVIEPAPKSVSQTESEPEAPFGESGAQLKEPIPAPAAELQPPAAVPNMPLPLPDPATRPRPSPTMPFTSGRPVPRRTSVTADDHGDDETYDIEEAYEYPDGQGGEEYACEECYDECCEDGCFQRPHSGFINPFLLSFHSKKFKQCDECESRWGLLGKVCPYWCDSGYGQPEIFNMPAGATLRAPLDPHGEYHSTEMPDWMKVPPPPGMDDTSTPPPGGGTEPKY